MVTINSANMQITPYIDGSVTSNEQVGFSVYVSTTQTNVTGSSAYTLLCDSELYDTHSIYNTATGIVTAPLTGMYHFCGMVRFSGIASPHSLRSVTGGSYTATKMSTVGLYRFDVTGGIATIPFSCLVDLDSGDSISFGMSVGGGSNTIDIIGGTSPYVTFMSGRLVA
jgi:hypothetical protein